MVLWKLRLFGKNKPFHFDWDLYLRNLIHTNYTITCSYCKHVFRYQIQPDKQKYECPNCETKNTPPSINLTKITHELLERAIHNLKLQFYHGVRLKKLAVYRQDILDQIQQSPFLSDALKKRLSETFVEESDLHAWTKDEIKHHIQEYLSQYSHHHKVL